MNAISVNLSLVGEKAVSLADKVTVTFSVGQAEKFALVLAGDLLHAPYSRSAHVLENLETKANLLYDLVQADINVGDGRVFWSLDPEERTTIANSLTAFHVYKGRYFQELQVKPGSTYWGAQLSLVTKNYTDLNPHFLGS